MRFVGRALVSVTCLGTVLVAALGACFPDPKGEFDDFKERTANLGPTDNPNADASIDVKPPETAVEGLYVGICTTILANKDPNQALRFYTETKFTPDGSGGGKVTLVVTPLVGWDVTNNEYITPKSVSKSETRGDTFTAADVPVAAGNGRFTANLGSLTLPREANSVTGRPVQIDDATLDGRYGESEFCAKLGGHLVLPYMAEFVPDENVCLFIKVKDGDPVPTRDANAFVCPF